MRKAILLSSLMSVSALAMAQKKLSSKPNIVIIYADDLGINDLSCYGAKEIKTPNIDKLAQNGVRFTNAYAAAATCTPSRFSLLTGVYPWKNKNARILEGDAPMLIPQNDHNLPSQLQKAGYVTGVVGKWHLGLGNGKMDWNQKITPSPNDIGFDYSFITAATNDRVPTVFVENHSVVGLEKSDPLKVSYKTNFPGEPTGKDNPELLKLKPSQGHNQSIHNGIPRIGYQTGGKNARDQWVDEDMADLFVKKAENFISENKNKPFFLYYALHQPHVPRTPNQRFVGSTNLGPRGDAVVEADWCVGQIMEQLKKENLLDNTLVIFSSDNGPVLDDGYFDGAEETKNLHQPWGKYKGGKYSMYNAGANIPLIVYWKGQTPQKVSDALLSQIDLPASLMDLVGMKNVTFADSQDYLKTFLGKSNKHRKYLLHEGMQGKIALRQGKWSYIPPYDGPKMVPWGVTIETGNAEIPQLYNLCKDPGETKNVADKHPNKMKKFDNLIKASMQ
ncbi:sulfatase family protein [Ornithobacterium rhinotracheale]|uniref:sulfatase family protein n=1 Tax=Ornithobacterium rhinotracheale TaxID=28251 RepID=UPI0040373EFE